MKRALILLAFLLAAATAAQARMMYITHHPCLSGGSGSYSAGYVDDRTGKSYMVVRDCWGNTCVYPLYGPFEPRFSNQESWRLPDGYDGMVSLSLKIKTPGVYTGIWVIDQTSGDTIRFRTAIDETEKEQYYQMWTENENGGPSLSMQEEFNRLVEQDLAQQNTEDRMNRDLIDRYWSVRFGENGWPTSDEMQSVANASALIVRNGTSIAVKQTPANGQALMIAPLLPELASPAAIYNESGQTVWSGQLETTVKIPFDHLPAGLYIIRGLGKDIPVTFVR